MNIDNGGNTDGVSASQDAQGSSPQPTSAAQPESETKNLKAEMNRKFSKINEQLSKLVSYVEQAQPSRRAPVEETESSEGNDVSEIVESKFVEKAQHESWSKALEMFPELNQETESFDEKFFSVADKYFSSFNLKKDPDAPIKAVKLAALELGKIEQLAKEKLLKDEARRSRIIAEGTSTARESKKAKEPEVNERALAKLGLSKDRIMKRLKENKGKYGEE